MGASEFFLTNNSYRAILYQVLGLLFSNPLLLGLVVSTLMGIYRLPYSRFLSDLLYTQFVLVTTTTPASFPDIPLPV